jgi:uncharacterized surface protein with fasciclin (FAS1) repeats
METKISQLFSKKLLNAGIIVLLVLGFFSSCLDEPEVISTFDEEMMGDYITNRPDSFSEFTKLLDTTEVMGLLNAYGKYTLFAPSNTAMRKFYASKSKSSLDDFSIDTLLMMAYDHIIKGYEISTDEFSDGLMPYLTMSDRYISTSSKTEGKNLVYYLNDKSAILVRDVEVSNGVVHWVNEVINPSVLDLVKAIAEDAKFSLFNEALTATGLYKLLQKSIDESYNYKDYLSLETGSTKGSGSIDELPRSRKYGFTALMESNTTFAANNIHNLDDLKLYAAQHVYNEDPADAAITDITDRRNSLNKFISYHLINRNLSYSKFIDAYDTDHMIKTYDMYEYIETMCPNTLIEVKKERVTGETNLFNKSVETGEAVRINKDYKDKDATNGVYHEIDKILIYNRNVAGEMSGKRIRIDAAAFFPEFVNNNMRYYDPAHPRSWILPRGYIERLKSAESTKFYYLNAFGGYLDYQGDEIFLSGMYDFSVVTPPIPAGTYEIRFGYQPTTARGAAQLYWDGVPCGIPLDLRMDASNPLIGFVAPGSDSEDPNGYENDKMLRNRGYMKGPSTFKDVLGVWYGKRIARNSPQYIRRILGTYTFTESSNHVFAVKAVREGEFMFDFLEFVPIELIETEGVE